jgi:hypothetical protein
MISGAPQYPGILDVDPTFALAGFPKNAPNLGTQLEAASIPWGSYQESSATACNLSAAGSYAPKHDPFLYFTDMQASALCKQRNVDYSSFAADLGAAAKRYYFITPNLTNDGHDPSTTAGDIVTALKVSDKWAETEVGKIMATQAYKDGGVIFITWDEAEGRNGDSKDQIPMIIVSESLKTPGMQSSTAYSHKSYLATVEDILGLPRLDTVKNEPSMMEFFQ